MAVVQSAPCLEPHDQQLLSDFGFVWYPYNGAYVVKSADGANILAGLNILTASDGRPDHPPFVNLVWWPNANNGDYTPAFATKLPLEDALARFAALRITGCLT